MFVLRDGIFKTLCARAQNNPPGRQYFLIIDEINRGDIPRIFGELLTVLEREKDATAAVIEIRDPVRAGALGYVALRPVALGELLEAVRVDGDPDRRVRLAKRLAFGTTQELVRASGPRNAQFGALAVAL